MGKINNASDNPRKYWYELNSIFNPTRKKHNDFITISESRTDIDLNLTADHMNNYFATIGAQLAIKITSTNAQYLDLIANKAIQSLLISWRPTNLEEVSNLIDTIDTHKSSQVKDVNSKLLKDCLLCTTEQVCTLFNRILVTGIFPDLWKVACVVPIHKGGCKKTVSNYRPISLLPIIAKLFEKLLHTRIYHFLNDNNFFTNSQGGFRPNQGTQDTIDTMLKYIYSHSNNSNYTSAVFFDLSKAFDSILYPYPLTQLSSSTWAVVPMSLYVSSHITTQPQLYMGSSASV